MRKFRSIRFVILTIWLLQSALPNVVLACPTCKAGLHDEGTAFAYACSILFMMAMPFVILSFWVTIIVRIRAKIAGSLLPNAKN